MHTKKLKNWTGLHHPAVCSSASATKLPAESELFVSGISKTGAALQGRTSLAPGITPAQAVMAPSPTRAQFQSI